jgi:hypothetical protein
MESGIYCKKLSSNGAPSKKLCPFYGRYLKLWFLKAQIGTGSVCGYGWFRYRIWIVDMVGFRDRICFVDRVGCRDGICFVDRVGFRDRICFVDRVGFVGWKRMDRIKLNQNKSKSATKLNLEHELKTADSKTELCKG